MIEWDDPKRSLGGGAQSAGPAAPTSVPSGDTPDHWNPVAFPGENPAPPMVDAVPTFIPAAAPVTPAAPEQWTEADEFDPRYCEQCHKRIPITTSDRQGVCDACFAARTGAGGANMVNLPGQPQAYDGPACPQCGNRSVDVAIGPSPGSGIGQVVAGVVDMLTYDTYTGSHFALFDNLAQHETVWFKCKSCGKQWHSNEGM